MIRTSQGWLENLHAESFPPKRIEILSKSKLPNSVRDVYFGGSLNNKFRNPPAERTGGGWGLMLDPGKGKPGKMQSFKTELMSAGTA